MSALPVRLTLIASAALTIGLLWFAEFPLGIPGEWTWTRIRFDADHRFDAVLGWLIAGGAAALYIAFVAWGARRIAGGSSFRVAVWLSGLIAAGFLWLTVLQESPPGTYRLQKAAWVLYYPGSSGYYYEARYRIDDWGDFLDDYEQRVRNGDVLHLGTHPPGLFLLHEGLYRLCNASPRLRAILLATQPTSLEAAFSTIETTARSDGVPFGASDRAALWLAALLTQFLAVATVIPLYVLLRGHCDRRSSWLAASFWPLVPALAIFLPKSDALYPVLGTSVLALWLTGWRNKSLLRGFLAGLLFWLGLFLSLALLPVALLAVGVTVWETCCVGKEASPPDPRRRRAVALAAVAGFVGPIVVLALLNGLNLPAVWWWNYRNHAAFYDQFPRTYWKWLLVNPVELAFAAGLPVVLWAGISTGKTINRLTGFDRRRELGPFVLSVAVWALLWLSGKNMGEAGRLWLFVMPWLIWLMRFGKPGGSPATTEAGWLTVLVVQAVVCIATVTHISGFHFGGL